MKEQAGGQTDRQDRQPDRQTARQTETDRQIIVDCRCYSVEILDTCSLIHPSINPPSVLPSIPPSFRPSLLPSIFSSSLPLSPLISPRVSDNPPCRQCPLLHRLLPLTLPSPPFSFPTNLRPPHRRRLYSRLSPCEGIKDATLMIQLLQLRLLLLVVDRLCKSIHK